MSEETQIVQIPVAELHFDRHNPRMAEFGIEAATPEKEILTTLWDLMDVLELVQSITASGFFPHEALIVAEEKGKKIVIEGNRRLAAVKVLLNPALAKDNADRAPMHCFQSSSRVLCFRGSEPVPMDRNLDQSGDLPRPVPAR
jgi:hypothetical protein